MLPDPTTRPLLTIGELVDLVPTLGRSAAYEAVRRGEIPHITYGRKVFVVTARLRQQWGIDPSPDMSEADPATGPALATTEPVVEDQHGKHPRIRAV
jgi:hypothetical protein